MTTAAELEKRIAEKRAAKATEATEALDKHNLGYLEALDKALDDHGERLVVVDIPHIGKCLFRYPGITDHTAFTREIHKDLELSPCKTYTSKCVIFPAPLAWKDLCDKINPEGYVKAALRIKIAMKGDEDAAGKD